MTLTDGMRLAFDIFIIGFLLHKLKEFWAARKKNVVLMNLKRDAV